MAAPPCCSYPTLHRPYRIPLPTWGCIAILTPACLLLAGLLVVPWATVRTACSDCMAGGVVYGCRCLLQC